MVQSVGFGAGALGVVNRPEVRLPEWSLCQTTMFPLVALRQTMSLVAGNPLAARSRAGHRLQVPSLA